MWFSPVRIFSLDRIILHNSNIEIVYTDILAFNNETIIIPYSTEISLNFTRSKRGALRSFINYIFDVGNLQIIHNSNEYLIYGLKNPKKVVEQIQAKIQADE